MKLTLSQDVKDLKGKVLIPKDKDVLEWAKKGVFSGEYLKKKSKFKDTGFLMEDCQWVFTQKPYDRVLKDWTPSFRDWVGEIWVPFDLLEELRLLKRLDAYSYQHSITIAVVGSRLLEIWIKAAPTVKRSFQAFLFHRVGKTRFPQILFTKGSDLNEVEKRSIYEQPMVGFVLNACYWGDANHLCAKVALQHQEDRKGKGYPAGIETSSLVLDVLRMLDRFDALISSRPFRYKSFTPREAFDLLQEDAKDGKMEEDVLKALIDLVREEKLKNYKNLKLGSVGRPTDYKAK